MFDLMAIRARLVAIIVGAIAAALTTWLGVEASQELVPSLTQIIDGAFGVLLLVFYAVIHPAIQKRTNPTGAMTKEAANKLELVAHVEKAT